MGISKKRMIKPFIVILIVLSMLLVLGCGKKKKQSKTEQGEESSAASPVNTEELTEAKAFAGEWVDHGSGTILDIWVGEDAVCHGEIIVTNTEDYLSFWSFTGTVMSGDIVNVDCIKSDARYDAAGDVTEEDIYTRGRGSISFSGKQLVWYDSNEDAGKDYKFDYFVEY